MVINKYPQFLLVGDSHIQYASRLRNNFSFGAVLAENVERRLDVVNRFVEKWIRLSLAKISGNRGFSGYNTSQMMVILEEIIPPPSSAKVDFMLILFGSNDACLPHSSSRQYLPLDKYRANIKSMITHSSVKAHNPSIFLVTPPPVNEVHLEQEELKIGMTLTKDQGVTATYAEAIREIALEFKGQQVILVDLWQAIMEKAKDLSFQDEVPEGAISGQGGTFLGSKALGDNEGLRELLYDGLHLSGPGYRVFLYTVLQAMGEIWGEEVVRKDLWVFPRWEEAPKMEEHS